MESAHEHVLTGVKSGVRKQEPSFFTGLLKTGLLNEHRSPHRKILAARFESEKITEDCPRPRRRQRAHFVMRVVAVLFIPQGHHGIDPCGANGWQVTGKQGAANQQRDCGREAQRIAWAGCATCNVIPLRIYYEVPFDKRGYAQWVHSGKTTARVGYPAAGFRPIHGFVVKYPRRAAM